MPAARPETAPRPSHRVRLSALVRAGRPRQWVKNLACLAGLIFSGQLFRGAMLARALLACAGFCLASSAVYLFNDVCDRDRDRLNPSKRDRPVASGELPVSWALGGSLLASALALAVGACLSVPCAAFTALYLALNVAYSVRLKHTVLLDVGLIAVGFVLRVLDGVDAVRVEPTSWVVLCMYFLALFLGFAKRRGELDQAGDDDPHRRPVLAKYRTGFLDTLLAMTATMAILCYALYAVNGGKTGNATLVVTVPLVTYGVTRYMLLVMVHGRGETPEKLLTSDPLLVGTVVAWVVLCVAILYSGVHLFSK